MCEYDQDINDLDIKRAMYDKTIGTLAIEHPKLYKKLMPVLLDISTWMIGAQDYMNDLKNSIDKENSKLNDLYSYMNQPLGVQQKAKKNV